MDYAYISAECLSCYVILLNVTGKEISYLEIYIANNYFHISIKMFPKSLIPETFMSHCWCVLHLLGIIVPQLSLQASLTLDKTKWYASTVNHHLCHRRPIAKLAKCKHQNLLSLSLRHFR